MCTKLVHMYTKLVLNSYHIDTELVPDWCQFSDENSSKLWQSIKQSIKTLANIGSTCVPNWYHNRTRLIPDWYRIDSTCAQHWYQIRTRLVPYFGNTSILILSQDIQQLLIQTASGALSPTSRDPKFAVRTNRFLTVLI